MDTGLMGPRRGEHRADDRDGSAGTVCARLARGVGRARLCAARPGDLPIGGRAEHRAGQRAGAGLPSVISSITG